MSHIIGELELVSPQVHIGPDSPDNSTEPNVWLHNFNYIATGTKFIILHFMNASLPANNRLEVDLGYDTDVFTASDGNAFWTRPINVSAFPGGTVPVRYITNGSNSGGVFIDSYGRAEQLQSFAPGHNSITNCDPFFVDGSWTEPEFPHTADTSIPKYDPYWICNGATPPVWQDARCGIDGMVYREVSRSCGMIVSIHETHGSHPDPYVSTCSVTLIDSNIVALAGHCIEDHPFSVPASSVTFDYEVTCDGLLVPAYNAVFYKVTEVLKYRYSDGRDYAILGLADTPPVPPIPVLNGIPAVGDPVFGVHHPNGAVKKIGPSAGATMPVLSTGSFVGVNLDVAGGSSGSGLFDLNGRFLGTLASGGACGVSYSSSQLMLNDPIEVPDPPTERAVMLVLDRSGSMSEDSLGGGTKMEEARAAADLFISMVRASAGNEVGLVSFSGDAQNPVEHPMAPFDGDARDDMIAELPGISPGGYTSVGDGLLSANTQLNTTSGIPRSILVLTDGMENRPASIADVGTLANTEVTAIGFGTESNLDGPRLTDLAQNHGGYYKRAGTGLELRKFFALAFGDIFEAGALSDPNYVLEEQTIQGRWIPFDVCNEEAATVVIGWDVAAAALELEIRTPSGQIVNLGAGGIEQKAGTGWRFVRMPLPQNGERNGQWRARVLRPNTGSTEFPPPGVRTEYFLSVIARGGPSLRPFQQPRRLYTGDTLNPKVMFQFPDETTVIAAKVQVNLRRPNASVGTKLSEAGLGPAKLIAGDEIPARQATMSKIEEDTGQPIVEYVEETHAMVSTAAATGTFMAGGVYGALLNNALVVDGTYTFHAKAEHQGGNCKTTREVQWSHHVHVGIDPDATPVDVDQQPNGTVIVTFTPQDKYGNLVGPGASGEFEIDPIPGCTLVGQLLDLGDGRYQQKLDCDPDSEHPPGVVVIQPERDGVPLAPTKQERKVYRYPVRFHCGNVEDCACVCEGSLPAEYATSISITNLGEKEALVRISLATTALAGSRPGHWPDAVQERAKDSTQLKPYATTVIDCCTLSQMVLKTEKIGESLSKEGVVMIESLAPLSVTATYTMSDDGKGGVSIDVEHIGVDVFTEAVQTDLSAIPIHPAVIRPAVVPSRPQDWVKRQRPRDDYKNSGDGKKDKKGAEKTTKRPKKSKNKSR